VPAGATPVFLERRRYRLRRIKDAVRILPVVGLVLWMIPLLWPAADAAKVDGVTTSQALLYIFAVWSALILASGLLWSRLSTAPEEADDKDSSESGD
jgi:hypothetical protein